MQLSPTIKGIIISILMVALALYIFSNKGDINDNLQFMNDVLYVGGIAWTLVAYSRKEVLKSFKTYFNEGFKFFIVVTMIMVVFTITFLNAVPSIKEEMAINMRTELMQQGNKTPAEIESTIIQAKEYYNTMMVSVTIFRNLLIGAFFTSLISIILLATGKKTTDETFAKSNEPIN